jgi:hypothetical protein
MAQSGSLCRLCVQTGVDKGHLLQNERERIPGGVESRVILRGHCSSRSSWVSAGWSAPRGGAIISGGADR